MNEARKGMSIPANKKSAEARCCTRASVGLARLAGIRNSQAVIHGVFIFSGVHETASLSLASLVAMTM